MTDREPDCWRSGCAAGTFSRSPRLVSFDALAVPLAAQLASANDMPAIATLSKEAKCGAAGMARVRRW